MSLKFRITILLIVLICFSDSGNCSRILGVFTSPSQSHLLIHMSVVRGLVDKGHNVTVVTTIPLPEKNTPCRHILLNITELPTDFFKPSVLKNMTSISKIQEILLSLIKHGYLALQNKAMQQLMAEESFDLVIIGYVFNDFHYGLGAHFNCPVVVIWINQNNLMINELTGNPVEISTVPQAFSGTKQPMDFLSRLKNYLYVGIDALTSWYLRRQMRQYYEIAFPSDKYPSYTDILKNVSLVLTCNHFSQMIRPNVPAMIEIGGVQVKSQPDPLPNDLHLFLDSANDHGAIYFSLGTNVQSSELTAEKIQIIFKVLSELKQKIIWKWEDNKLPGHAKNIMFKKWLPQDDVLAHPNVKLFISHGGLGSIVESKEHSVPILGLPIFGDQFKNMETVVEDGWGITLDYETLDEDYFRQNVFEILTNSKYTDRVNYLSQLYKDRPATALETAVYWIGYVIRHNGAAHMQSPAVHMSFIEYHSIDVIGFYLFTLFVIWKIIKQLFKLLYCCLVRKKDSNKDKKD